MVHIICLIFELGGIAKHLLDITINFAYLRNIEVFSGDKPTASLGSVILKEPI